MQAQDIPDFWFDELGAHLRFAKDTALDDLLRARFATPGPCTNAARAGISE